MFPRCQIGRPIIGCCVISEVLGALLMRTGYRKGPVRRLGGRVVAVVGFK